MFCNKCGKENSDDASFCSSCGNDLTKVGSNENKNNIVHPNVKKKQELNFGLIINWLFSFLFGLAGFGALIDGLYTDAILLLLMTIIIFPPITNWVKKNYNFKLAWWLKLTIILILLTIYGSTVPDNTSLTNDISSENIPQTSNPIATPIPASIQTPTPDPTATPTATPIPTPTPQKIVSKSFAEFDKIFGDSSSLTELQKENKFETEYKEKVVIWKGYVIRVYEGWTGDYCIRINTNSPSQTTENFKVCYEGESNMNELLSLGEGNYIEVTGTIQDYQDLYPKYYVEGIDVRKL